MEKPEHDNNSTKGIAYGFGFYLFLIFLVLMGCVYGGIRSTQTYLSLAHLEKEGVQTTGTNLERIRIASSVGEKSRSVEYYLRYSFENIYAKQDCPVEVKTRETPKYRECRTTVRKQIISESDYNSLSIPGTVNVHYLSEDNKTKSYVMDLGGGKNRYVFLMALFFLFSLLTGRFLWKVISIGPDD